MRLRLFPMAILPFILLMLILCQSTYAQDVEAPPTPLILPAKQPATESYPFLPLQPFSEAQFNVTSANDAEVGRPGLSFRYAQTFGVTGEPYLEDNNYFYNVAGVGIDGNHVWVTDSWGRRVLEFDADGNFLRKIGKAGVKYATGTALAFVSDVGVDSQGSVWVVDGEASYVAKFAPDGTLLLRLGTMWEPGADNSHFNQPLGIAFDGADNVYVSDSGLWGDYGNHRVQIFDNSGNYLATIGQTGVSGSGNDQLHQPRRIAVYDDLLYIADSENHRVQIFDISIPISPVYVATLGTTGVSGTDESSFNFPEGVGAGTDYIYVADSNNHRIQVFNRQTLAYVATYGSGYGTDAGQFDYPSDVVADTAGRIYVADNHNNRVQQFDSSGQYLRTYGTTDVPYRTDALHYYEPQGVAVAPDGSIYIAEAHGHRLIKLNADGEPQWTIGSPGISGSDNDHLAGPIDVAVDNNNRIYAVENWDNHRVQIFNADGTYHATLGSGQGSDDNHFDQPSGIDIDDAGQIYVADSNNHRIQIFDASTNYLATLGVTGSAGDDNTRFNYPRDVAVDSNGVIYIADERNHRVQVFDRDFQYVRTIGQGIGYEFDQLAGYGPHRLAVDSQDRLYVTDSGNGRVQVFDSDGAYLTTIGSATSGGEAGRFNELFGLAVGPDDSVYTTEISNNQRIQKFSPGVTGWQQVNINGFGSPRNTWIGALQPFNNDLYAAGYRGYIWRLNSTGQWQAVSEIGIGEPVDSEVDAMAVFGDHLYAMVLSRICDNEDCTESHRSGPQSWRTADGVTWENVTPESGIGAVTQWGRQLLVFDEYLYVALGDSAEGEDGADIWRTADGLNWERALDRTVFNPNPYNTHILALAEYNGKLYASTRHGEWSDDNDHPDGPLGGEVWRSDDGLSWKLVNEPGFGDIISHRIERLIVFDGALYAYASRMPDSNRGAEIWRCTAEVCDSQNDWSKVFDNGGDYPQDHYIYSGIVFGGYLYAVVPNWSEGFRLWRTADGEDWAQIAPDFGLGDVNNGHVSSGAMAEFQNRLYLGTRNGANGGEIWTLLHRNLYLPVMKNTP